MSDVRRLLAEATPLPWTAQWDATIVGRATGVVGEFTQNGDADLAVAAVNHLPDYLAAVEALEYFIDRAWLIGMDVLEGPELRDALARLRSAPKEPA